MPEHGVERVGGEEPFGDPFEPERERCPALLVPMETGERYQTVELSTIDTGLLVMGALFSQSYFDRDDPVEREIRDLAEKIYSRIEWPWYQVHSSAITMSWKPEVAFGQAEYRGYNGNPGEPNEQGLYHDGRAALDFLLGDGVASGDS